jgi:hypothetical protein
MGGGFAALALLGWVGAMGDRNLNAVVMAIGWTLLAAVYIISGLPSLSAWGDTPAIALR